MDYSFIIRPAVEDDAEAIKSVLHESFQKYMKDAGLTGTMEALQESVEDIKKDIREIHVFIALIDNEPVGTIRVRDNMDGTAYISRFGVRPEYHNIGIGKALITLVDKLMVSKNIKRVYLHTASKYKNLVRFYYDRGFYVHSTSFDRGYVRALMVKDYD